MAPTSSVHASPSAGEQEPNNPPNRCLSPRKPGRRGPKTKPLKAVAPPPRGPVAARSEAEKPKRMSGSERGAKAKVSRPCDKCGKRFWSEKALFGHMRWHGDRRRRRGDPPAAGQISPAPQHVGGLPSGPAAVAEGAPDELAEIAAACLVVMSGGQVTKPVRPRKAKWKKEDFHGLVMLVATAVSAAAASSTSRDRGCGFDLNLPPPEEAEGGASSSSSSGIRADRKGGASSSSSSGIRVDRKLPVHHGFV